ncbi:MAG TPA: glycosyltransferase, partial [Labilithrix sp.]|nr:glycosyltransferase [Labilithrix sp.]
MLAARKLPSADNESAPRIRLCMAVNNLNVGGLERLVISLVNHLPRERYELSLVCLSGEGKLFSQVDLPRSACLVLDKDPDLGRATERARVPVLMYRIARFLGEQRVDILDVHNLAPLVFAGGAARLMPFGPRVIYTEHNQ